MAQDETPTTKSPSSPANEEAGTATAPSAAAEAAPEDELGALDLEHAEPLNQSPEQPPQCASCRRALTDSYYEVNRQPWCPVCHAIFHERLFSPADRLGRVLRAVFLGGLAAIVGSLIYYAISATTGYEFGLIGIFVGLGVGAAVQRGARGRGGRGYQALAMALTYLAIVSTYAPAILKAVSQGAKDGQTQQQAAPTAGASPTATPASAAAPAANPASTAAPAAAATPAPATSPAPAAAPSPPPMPSLGPFLLAMLIIFGLILASPFLAGFQNIMGWFIIGFSLYEAWKINKRPQFTVSGPFTLHPGAGHGPSAD